MRKPSLLERLELDYPDIRFVQGEAYYWSPQDKSVTYGQSTMQPDIASWSLLHEVSHGILNHTGYQSDFELMELEVAAWQHARTLAKHYGMKIDPEHIEDCLDTYRDWLHRRSTCPTCRTVSLQSNPETYTCFNCQTSWRVSTSRFCRPYRKIARV
jgi:hypothetical protein